MTFPTQAQVVAREPVRIVELVLDACVLRYGNMPCPAGVRAVDHPNLVKQSEVLSGTLWSSTAATVTMSQWVAPNSTMTGVTVTDSNNALSNYRGFNIAGSLSVLPASCWMLARMTVAKQNSWGEGGVLLAQMFFNGSGTNFGSNIVLDKSTGVWSKNSQAFDVTVMDVGSAWEIRWRGNRNYHPSMTFAIYPAANSAGVLAPGATVAACVGSAGIWGVMVQADSGPRYPYLARGVESQWLTNGFADACYNTIQTCTARSSYLKGTKTLRFIDERVDQPEGIEGYPALVDVNLTPARLAPLFGLGESAQLKVRLKDFPDSDLSTDPYTAARSYTPFSSGTFFGKLTARDPYMQRRPVRYYEGYYVGSGTFTFSHYLMREFIMESLSGPDGKGGVRLEATDVLRLTNYDRAQCPVPSTQSMITGFAVGVTTLWFPSSAAAAAYGADFHVRLDEELIKLGTQVGCSFQGCVRAQGGTETKDHSSGTVVQLCKTYSYTNVCSILQDLLVNFASIPSSYINTTSWDAEKTLSLTDYNLFNIIGKPRPVRDLIDEICETCDLAMWYDEVAVSIALRQQTPWQAAAVVVNDEDQILKGSLKLSAREDLKISRVGISYAPTNYLDSGEAEFSRYIVAVNSLREDARFDGAVSEHQIKTSWLSTSHNNLAATIAGRTMVRYSEFEPVEASFSHDAKDAASIRTGAVVEMSTRQRQNIDGTRLATRMMVIESAPDEAGHSYDVSALLFRGLGAQTSIAIDVSTYNYNVHSAAGGPSGAVNLLLTVNSGIYVGGSGPGQYAITTSGLPAGSIVYLTGSASAEILGYAGARGEGGEGESSFNEDTREWEFSVFTQPSGGGAGGGALYVAPGVTVYIDVSASFLFAGGPGGGGGGIEWNGGPAWTDGGFGGVGQGFTNSGGPTAPETVGVLDGGSGAVWGGTALSGVHGTWVAGAAAGAQGYAVKLADASAVYYFTGGYDAAHVKGLVGV